MKRTTILLALVFGIFANTQASDKIVTDFNLNDFSKNKIVLEIPFGKSNILNPIVLDEIKKQKIEKITLVYTTYKEANKFSQEKLNKQRIKALFKILPSAKQIEIEYLGVEKCIERNCAQNQLHGFIIEYKTQALHYSRLETQTTTIQANKDAVIKGKKGTSIHIEANSFQDLNGKSIEGEISIELLEAFSPEDIVKANLITVTDKGEALQSDGMILVKAFSNDKELQLKSNKEMIVNMPKNNLVDDMKVWEGNWEDGELVWENSEDLESKNEESEIDIIVSINKPIVPVLDTLNVFESNMETGRFRQNLEGMIIVSADYIEVDNKIGQIKIKTSEGEHEFYSNTYNVRKAMKLGMSSYQAKKIKKWFSESSIEDEVEQKFFGWTLIWINANTIMDKSITGLNTGHQNSVLHNTFRMKKLGWANIDRLASFANSEIAKLEIKCPNDSIAENITITLMIPERNIYLPGYKMASGNYCFSHGDYEKRYSLPVGDQAFVIMMGDTKGVDFSVLQEITLGEKEVEMVLFEEADVEEVLKEIEFLF